MESEAYEGASARSGRAGTIRTLKSYETGDAEEGIWRAGGCPALPGTPSGDAPASLTWVCDCMPFDIP